ncbi:hypothetical protein A3D00_01210 [Candidatus Woesebacteria bacterium RIFCSPHIGHO2_02_FULL_38_9]|uniref:Nudix hydrolase domain-containing protein n=1 Tax=Candidatus Woesebacteria bacterium RIFCSPHIGHO2_01_FULL_39_28 TaxID=1802496 RepID=A0A1F7YJ37_9BACT|nr:MAG: hypothetical protein A2627_01185 [Candidatus Woesebacteria bacterium RIFCSPHIGHO2_01_FULL_39_28]OGM31741.1 MAG: hypothetical protein A3D00_01210 [Candidatus Woesebacteria bacterium RIFCSPHIGHO2_02_FULL_38_9]OGM57683.1 MAG: hypothetical protein A3A50_01585 [Candidatus Woesebacteria bacterium RIFCSPLOWO2_01_FULL_38_20]
MNRKQPLTYDEFKVIYSKVPRLCVDLVIKNNKEVLLTLRQKNGYEGQWHLPGGTVYYREPIQKAIKRIAKEELGIEISIEKFVGYLEYFSEEKERGFGYTVSLVFRCKSNDSNLNLDNQVEKAQYFKTPPNNTIVEQKDLLIKLSE